MKLNNKQKTKISTALMQMLYTIFMVALPQVFPTRKEFEGFARLSTPPMGERNYVYVPGATLADWELDASLYEAKISCIAWLGFELNPVVHSVVFIDDRKIPSGGPRERA